MLKFQFAAAKRNFGQYGLKAEYSAEPALQVMGPAVGKINREKQSKIDYVQIRNLP